MFKTIRNVFGSNDDADMLSAFNASFDDYQGRLTTALVEQERAKKESSDKERRRRSKNDGSFLIYYIVCICIHICAIITII